MVNFKLLRSCADKICNVDAAVLGFDTEQRHLHRCENISSHKNEVFAEYSLRIMSYKVKVTKLRSS